jgi:uncharacterized protein
MGDATRPSIDVHVHLHPPRLADAIVRHFGAIGWKSAHPWDPDGAARALAEHGVERFCCFSYAHRPGMARSINAWLAEHAARVPGSIPFGTVHTDDPDCTDVAREAVGELGLAGLKIHCSVQRISADDPRLVPVYETVLAAGRAMMLHAGTAPYRDEHTGIDRVRPVMERFPELSVCVAHLGAHDQQAFLALTERYPNLYLDTTMVLAPVAQQYVGADPAAVSDADIVRYQDRILFGSDFPLIPYAYEEERRWAVTRDLPERVQRKIFYENAVRFLGLA